MSGAYTNLTSLYRLKHKARGFSFLPRQSGHSVLAGRHITKLRGRGLNFEEIRHYRPGDDTRAIDWKVTARTGKPHTRVFTEERDRPAILVVDQRPGMFFGSKLAMKSVVAAEFAALAAWRILAVGDRVGGVIFNEFECASIRSQRSEKTVLQLLKTITAQNERLSAKEFEAENSDQLNKALELARRNAVHDSLVIVVSDLRGADEKTRQILTEISRHNSVIICFVADPVEKSMPNVGKLLASDCGVQLEFDSSKIHLRSEYEALYQTRLDDGKKLLLKRRIPLLMFMTDEPVYDQMVRQVGQDRWSR
jgi:uncharacterized protein (DUF58 family)